MIFFLSNQKHTIYFGSLQPVLRLIELFCEKIEVNASFAVVYLNNGDKKGLVNVEIDHDLI